jgi:hypothetical protein
MREGNRSPSGCRELVPIGPAAAAPPPRFRPRCDSAFVAHLIAMAEQVPQLREKRRAEPDEANAAYAAALQRLRAQ